MGKLIKAIQKFFVGLTESPSKGLIVTGGLLFLSYSNIFLNDFVIIDFDLLVGWPLTQEWVNLQRFFVGFIPPDGYMGVYSPIRTFVFALLFHLSHFSTIGYHLAALVIHAVGTIFVYRIVKEVFGPRKLAWFSALFFAIHPIHVEAVTFMTHGIETLGPVFFLIAFYMYVKALGVTPLLVEAEKERKDQVDWKNSAYKNSLIFAFLASFINEVTLCLPFVILLYDMLFLKRKEQMTQRVLRWSGFFIIMATYLIVKKIVLGGIFFYSYINGNFFVNLGIALHAFIKYLWLCIFPLKLSYNHILAPGIFSYNAKEFDLTLNAASSVFGAFPWISAAVVAGLFIAFLATFRKNPLVAFCIGWFFICLFPALPIFPTAVYFAERFAYLASLGFCVLLSYGFYLLDLRIAVKDSPIIKRIQIGILIVIAVAGGTRIFLRNMDFRNQKIFYEAVVRENPESALMKADLGIVYFKYGESKKAQESLEAAIALRPKESHFYFSIEPVYSALGQYEKAEKALTTAIALNPNFAEAYFNLAGMASYKGDKIGILQNLAMAVGLYRAQGRVIEAGEAIKQIRGYMAVKRKILEGYVTNQHPEVQ